jgi:hypothetical protein
MVINRLSSLSGKMRKGLTFWKVFGCLASETWPEVGRGLRHLELQRYA